MVLKTALVLAKRFLTSTVVVILMLGLAMAWVWNQYEKTVEQRIQNATAEIALSKRETELAKREFLVQQREKDHQEQLANLQKRDAEYSVVSARLKQEQAAVSEAQNIKAARKDIERLMSEFSAYGVDLSRPPCNDAEAKARYNAAQAKYAEIYTLADAYKLKDLYKTFLNSNARRVIKHCWGEPLHIVNEVNR